MAFMGLDPEKARTLSSVMRQTRAAADDLSSEVTAALTLSQLDSQLPGQLVFTGEELEQLGLIVAARVDIAEGFVIDPATLAADVGITVAQAEAAIAAFAEPEAEAKQLTPFLDALTANKQAAEILRSSFVNLPGLGSDPAIDQALLRLGTWLPDALESGELPELTEEQILDMRALADGLELDTDTILSGFDFGAGGIATEVPGAVAAGLVTAAGITFGADTQAEIARTLFDSISGAFKQDQKLRAAAGLPSLEDLYIQYQIDIDNFNTPFDPKFEALDAWLPAYLAGEIKEPPNLDDPATQQLILDLARAVGYGTISGFRNFKTSIAGAVASVAEQSELDVDTALRFLRGGRFLQKSLIAGDFESIDGPVIVWSENGVESALLAGRRQGVITDQTEAVANLIAENVLVNPDGSDIPIDLSEEQQQALVAAIIAQNGREFVLDSPSIQRQVVSAVNLVRQQTTLADQRIVFAKAIEAFRSLAVVGSPAVTWTQLKEVVGKDVVDELDHKRLASRSTKATNKHPQFISLLSHWGIPGGDKIKLKKRKFSFRFDEFGRLTKVRNKKLSKWKRFKNSVKAFGKALWNDWTDNPWKFLFMGYAGLLPGANQVAEGVEDGDFGDIAEGSYEMAKFSATIAATVFPATTAAGVAAMTVLAADTVYQVTQGDWLGALGSAFSVAGGAAGFFGDVAAVGSTANIISKGATVGEGLVTAVDVGDDFVEAIEDGDIFGALGSGFALAGSVASVVSSGSELANGIGQRLSGNPIVNADALKLVTANSQFLNEELLEQTFTNPVVSSSTIGLIDEFGQAAADLGAITTGVERTLDAVENDDLAGALTNGFATLGRGAVAIGNPNGVLDNGFTAGSAVLGTVGEFGTSAVQLAGIAAQTGATIEAIEQGNVAGGIVGGINTIGRGIDAATDDRGIIDDGLGISEGTESTIRAGGVSLTDFGTVVGSGFATADAIGNDDLAGALSSGFSLAGNAADFAANTGGIVPGLVGLDGASLKALNSFSDTTAVKLSEASQIGGAIFDGEVLGVLENVVDFAQVDVEAGSRLEGQLNVADKGLDIGRKIEGVVNTGQLPSFQQIIADLGELKTAAERVPEAAEQALPTQSELLGRDSDGNLLVDGNGDGIADQTYLLAGSGQHGLPSAVPPSTSVGMAPEAERTKFLLRAKRDISAIDLRLAELEAKIDAASRVGPDPGLSFPGELPIGPPVTAEMRSLQQQRAQLQRRREGIEWLIETPGANLDEIAEFEGNWFVVNNNTDAADHYFNDGNEPLLPAPGTPAVLGPRHRDAILNHPELRAELERAASSGTQSGKLKLNFTTDLPNFHLGRHDVHYTLDRSDPNRTRVIIKSDHKDGIKDVGWFWVATGDDQLGPDGEWRGSTPYLYKPFEASIDLNVSQTRGVELPLPERPQPFGGSIGNEVVLPIPDRPVQPNHDAEVLIPIPRRPDVVAPLSERPGLLPTPSGVAVNSGDGLTVHSLDQLQVELAEKQRRLAVSGNGGRMPAMRQVLEREIEQLKELQANTRPGIDARIANIRDQRNQLLNYRGSDQQEVRLNELDAQMAKLEDLKQQQIAVPTSLELLGDGTRIVQAPNLPDFGLRPGSSLQIAVAGGAGPQGLDFGDVSKLADGTTVSGGAGGSAAIQIGRTLDGNNYLSAGGDAVGGISLGLKRLGFGYQEIDKSAQVQVIYPPGSREGFAIDLATLDELKDGVDLRVYGDGEGSGTQLNISSGYWGFGSEFGRRDYERYVRFAKERGEVILEQGSIEVASEKLGVSFGPSIGKASAVGDIFAGVTTDIAVPYVERAAYDPKDPASVDQMIEHYQSGTVPKGIPHSRRIEIDRQVGVELSYQSQINLVKDPTAIAAMVSPDLSANKQLNSTSTILESSFDGAHQPTSTELKQIHGNVVARTTYGSEGRIGPPTRLQVDLSGLSKNEAMLLALQNLPDGAYDAHLDMDGEQLDALVKQLAAMPPGSPAKAALDVPTGFAEQFGRVVTPALIGNLNLQLPERVGFVVEPMRPMAGVGEGVDSHRPSASPAGGQARAGRKTPTLPGGIIQNQGNQ